MSSLCRTVSINLYEWRVKNNDYCGMLEKPYTQSAVYAFRQEAHSSEWSAAALYPARGGDDPLSVGPSLCVHVCLGLSRQPQARSLIGPVCHALSAVVR